MKTEAASANIHEAFDGYLNLQSESYEFIARTISVHDWLQDAYQLFLHQPKLSAKGLYKEWHPFFNQVYEQLFAFFLRPYRLVIQAFEQLINPSLPSFGNPPFDAYLNLARGLGEAQSNFLSGFTQALQSNNQASPESLSSKIPEVNEETLLISSSNSRQKLEDAEIKAYLEKLEEFCNFHEDALPLSKPIMLNLRKICTSYPKISSLSLRHQTMFYNTWNKSLRKFTLMIRKKPESMEFEAFFNTYVNTLAEDYDQLLRSSKFISVQNGFMVMTSELTVAVRKAIELSLESSPFLPFPTRGEIESFANTINAFRRKISTLENKVMELEEKLDELTLATPDTPLIISKTKFKETSTRR